MAAWNAGARFQNHSHNNYACKNNEPVFPFRCIEGLGGDYTLQSYDYDRAVRDANGTTADGLQPMTIVVSAGNRDQPGTSIHPLFEQWPDRDQTLDPATAKNVIGVGAAESYRPDQAACRGNAAESFFNSMMNTRFGTDIGGVMKPDVMAPGSSVVAARSSFVIANRCVNDFGGWAEYVMDSGTSFAAPVITGAAAIVARKYSSSPSAAKPSLIKAMLAGSAKNLYGGTHKASNTMIPTRPHGFQGFGRANFDRLFRSISQLYINESHLLTGTGQLWTSPIYNTTVGEPIIVALAWTDAPGTASVDTPLVNDLDPKVNFTDTQFYIGNSFTQSPSSAESEASILYMNGQSTPYDGWNNVEIVRFTPTASTFRVRVLAGAINGNGVPGNGFSLDQDFSLWIYNAW